MATYAKFKLSGSTDGRFIKVTGTNLAGAVTVHTADPALLDEPVVSAWNTHTDDVTLTIRYGHDDDLLSMIIPPNVGLVSVLPLDSHQLLTNSLVIKAYASVADKIYLGGCIHRVTN